MEDKKIKILWLSLSVSFISLLIAGFVAFKPLFGRDNIIIEGANELRIRQDWGKLFFDQYISVRNIGTKQGTIVSIEGVIISKDSPFRKEIQARSFYYQGDGRYLDVYPMLNIYANPDGAGSLYIRLFEEPSKYDKEQIVHYKNIWNDVNVDRYSYHSDEDYDALQKKRQETFVEIKDFMLNSYKDFKEGQYEYIVLFKKNNKKKPFYSKRYSFVIYKSNLQELENSMKNYYFRDYLYPQDEYIVVTLNPLD